MIKKTLEVSENSDNDSLLSVYRERLMFRFMLIFILLFLPLMVFNFVRGQNALGAALGGMLVIILLNVAAIYFKKGVYVARTAFIIGLAAVVGIALVNRAAYGTYWTYPTVIFISFSMSRQLAKLYTGIFFLYCSALMFNVLSAGLALRATVGLAVTIVFVNIFLDIIENLQETLVEQSVRDPLTKAFNRRQMMSSLEEAIERKRRTRTPASILIFDIDNFKSINDKYGHAAGDQVLKEFVALVTNRARRLDRLFRTGGEEFMLFLPDTPGSGAWTLAEEIRHLVSKADFIRDCPVTVSIGLSELQKEETIDEWMKHGDKALYTAKENGKNRVFSRPLSIIRENAKPGKDNFVNSAGF